MNFLDLFIAIPLGYLIYKGWRRGLIFELASLAGIVLGSILAVRFANLVAGWVGLDGKNALLIAFFIIFVLVIVLSLVLAKAAENFVKLVHVKLFNNLAGALFGMLKGVCIIGVLLYYVSLIDINERVLSRDTKETSLLYLPVEQSGKRLAGKMDEYIDQRKAQHEAQEEELGASK